MLGKGLQLAQVSELSKLAKSVGLARLCDLAGDDLLLVAPVVGCCCPNGCISIKVVAGPAAIILIIAAVEQVEEEE